MMIGFLYPVALLVAPGTAVLAGLRVGARVTQDGSR